jgi:hypothetical protein
MYEIVEGCKLLPDRAATMDIDISQNRTALNVTYIGLVDFLKSLRACSQE